MLIKPESRILYMVRSYVWAMVVKAFQSLFRNVLSGLIYIRNLVHSPGIEPPHHDFRERDFIEMPTRIHWRQVVSLDRIWRKTILTSLRNMALTTL